MPIFTSSLDRRAFSDEQRRRRPRARLARACRRRLADHPVRVIVPYPAGGSTDVLARILAERMKDMLGQTFVVENRPGAGGNIGIAAVDRQARRTATRSARRPSAISPSTSISTAKMPYDAEKDMIPASLTWELPNVFVVAADHVPAKTVAEFIAWAKQKGNVNFGSPGVGTSPHLSGVLFAKRDRHRRRACAVPRRGADDPGDAVGRRHFRDRQSRLLHRADPVRQDARAGRDLGASAGRPCRTCRPWRRPA